MQNLRMKQKGKRPFNRKISGRDSIYNKAIYNCKICIISLEYKIFWLALGMVRNRR